MRRLSLSTKLFAAALPLIIAVGGLLALTVRSDLDEIDRAESGADLGGVWEPLIAALNAVEAEADTLDDATADTNARRTTDQALNELRTSIEELGAFEAASAHVTAGRSALSAARRNADMSAIAPEMATDVDPIEAYGVANREFVAVGQLLPSEAGDAELGRELLAVVKLAEAKLHANDVLAGTRAWADDSSNNAPLTQARSAFGSLITTFGEFEAIAPEDWGAEFRQSGFTTTLGRFNTELTGAARAADAGRVEAFDSAAFDTFIDQVVDFERTISQSIVEGANADADATRSATLRRIGIILAIVLVATVIAWFITRSVTRRVKAVANSANRIAADQLPALVEALRDPRGKAVLPEVEPVDAKGGDDLADLAHAFNSMQETLIDVAHEQVEVLRRGVSDIFITMARRNRSLIDRQLSMLDEFEAGVDDHEVLSNYYQLDHLATRMRRNSESLLVLANAEPKRRRVKATEIDDVVRASIGEVEDYRRVEIQHLESLQVRGNVVADVSHLLAELLDNATSFSPPGSAVRVGGRRADDSYLLRIVDDGVGINPERLGELNELLREPPIVGLSVESTLGISVVSLLANKHGINVTLSAGSPGLTVDVVLPSSLFGPMDAPADQPGATTIVPQLAAEPMVAWNEQVMSIAEPAVTEPAVAEPAAPEPLRIPEPTEPVVATEPAVATEPFVATEPPDWTKMSLDVSAFDPASPSETAGSSDTKDADDPVAENTPVPAAADELIAAEQAATDALRVPDPTEQADWTETSFGVSAFDTTDPSASSDTSDTSTAPDSNESPVPALPTRATSPEPAPAGHTAADPVAAAQPLDGSETSFRGPALDTSDPSGSSLSSDGSNTTAPVPSLGVPTEPVAGITPEAVEPVEPVEAVRPEPLAPAASSPNLPPPSRPPEFNVPPAPPITANGVSQRPVSPATARPAPVPVPSADPAPPLPTRAQGGTGPDGPDRLASTTGESAVTTSEPGALQAALAAFDSGRAAVKAPTAHALPTRGPNADPGPMADELQPVTQSRVDPSALRDRLRAFQSEFSSASGDHAGGSDIYTDQNRDSGGDPR